MIETISHIRQILQSIYPAEEARNLCRMAVCHVTGLEPHQLLSCKDRELSMSEKKKLEEITARLVKEEPIQYILGKAVFYELQFRVTPDTLIPRPETEELVEYILSEQPDKQLHVLDIGTGSGCIAISLAKHLNNAAVDAMDISPEALKVAEINADSNQVMVHFIQGDILDNENLTALLKEEYDVIVSNPPYVTEKEKGEMDKNVLEHEPPTALFVKDNDPLLFYRRIMELSKQLLTTNGTLYFEINRAYGKEVMNLLQEGGYNKVVLKKDLYGNDRIIKAKL